MKKLSFNDQETALLQTIKTEIEGMVDNKIHSIYKLAPHSHISKKAVEKDSTDRFFKELEKKFDGDIKTSIKFYDQLEKDDAKLYKQIVQEIEKVKNKLPDLKKLDDFKEINEHKPSKDQLDQIYQLGAEWFKNEDYDKANLYFTFLSLIDAENPQVWFSKGMAEQNLGKHEDSLNSYLTSITLAPHNLVAYIQIMDTLILMKDFPHAHNIYEIFMREVAPEDYSHNAFLVSKLNTIRDFLQKAA